MTSRVLRARWVLAFRDGDHRLLDDGEIYVRDSQIISVHSQASAPHPPDDGAEVIDLGRALLMPGFVDLDALSDIDHAILDSWQSPRNGRRLQWSRSHASTDHEHVLSVEDRRIMRRFAFAQLVMHGVTTAMPISSEVHSAWAETFEDATIMAEEAERIGIRAYIGPSYRAAVPVVVDDGSVELMWNPPRGEDGLTDAVRFLDWAKERSSPLIEGALVPCRIETMTDALLASTARVASERNVAVRLHAMQGLAELDALRRRGSSPMDLIERAGLLTDRLLIPHAIYTASHPDVDDEADTVERLARSGATIIHCPLTSAHYGMALHSFDAYLRAGVAVAMGTDSFPPDMLRGIDIGSSIAKIIEGRNDAGAYADYIRAATVGGADALRRPDLGRIAMGAKADVIAVRLDDERDGVIDDAVRSAIQHTTARAVVFAMVDGGIRVRKGVLVGEDMRELQREAQRIFELLREGYAERTDPARPASELFPPTFVEF